MQANKLSDLAKIIAILLVGYFLVFHTGFVFTVICVSFLVVIGVLLLGKRFTDIFKDKE